MRCTYFIYIYLVSNVIFLNFLEDKIYFVINIAVQIKIIYLLLVKNKNIK